MKRIAIDTTALASERTGIGYYCDHLCRHLQSCVAELEFRFYFAGSWLEKAEPRQAKDIAPIVRVKNSLRSFKSVIPFKDRLKERMFLNFPDKQKPDLLHEPNYIPPSFRVPFISTLCDLSFIRYPETMPKDRLRWLEKGMPKVLDEARAFITISEFSRSELESYYGIKRDNITVTHMGVDSMFCPADFSGSLAPHELLKKWGLKQGSYFLSVATLEPRKNFKLLLKAYTKLSPSFRKHFPLVLTGGQGWGAKTWTTEEQAMIDKGEVRFTGYLPESYLPVLYSGALAFLYPSLYEGFGIPLIEAMNCGTPVLSSNTSSLPEVAGKGAILLDPLFESDWSNQMQNLAESSLLREAWIEKGFKNASRFSWQSCAEKTLELYKQHL